MYKEDLVLRIAYALARRRGGVDFSALPHDRIADYKHDARIAVKTIERILKIKLCTK